MGNADSKRSQMAASLRDTYPNAFTDRYSYRDANGNGHCNTDCYAYCYSNRYRYSHPDSYCHTRADRDRNSYGDT